MASVHAGAVLRLDPIGVNCHPAPSSQSSGLSSPIDCPSLSESFISTTTTLLEAECSRRPSTTADSSPPWSSRGSSDLTSPITPFTNVLDRPCREDPFVKCEDGFGQPQLYDPLQYDFHDGDVWRLRNEPHASIDTMISMSSLQLIEALNRPHPPHANINASLSRPIFRATELMQPVSEITPNILWSAHGSSPLQTIAPSAAFQPMYNSSPISKYRPSTPCRRSAYSSAMLDSSPSTLISPPVVRSQHDVDEEFAYRQFDGGDLPSEHTGRCSSIDEDVWSDVISPERTPGRPTMHRRSYERRSKVGPSQKPKSAAGGSSTSWAPIIPQNEFACSFPNCIDPRTTKQKRFKRQEHKKRHEKTVHLKVESYKCWVPCCKTSAFSRSDNLKSHLKRTHGKKSSNQRNRYVATQDEDSPYYDPLWQGDLDADGFPIYSSKDQESMAAESTMC
jgi:hypothetical protein